jgi:hypothetical protein
VMDGTGRGCLTGVGYNGGNKKYIKNTCGETSLKSSTGTIEIGGER